MGMFDLLTIEWNGETLACRPIEWDGEMTEESTKPVQYECTCPACGHLVHFGTSADKVTCDNCHSWASLSLIPESADVPNQEAEIEQELETEPEVESEVEPEPELEENHDEPEPAVDPEPGLDPAGFVLEENPLAGLKIDNRKPTSPQVVQPKPSIKKTSIETKSSQPKPTAPAPKADKLRSVQKTDIDKLLQKLKKR